MSGMAVLLQAMVWMGLPQPPAGTSVDELRRWSGVDISVDNPAYVAPLRRDATELAAAIGERENNVSNHLARLRDAGLVRASRHEANARFLYYERDEAVVALLSGQVIRGVKALAHYLEGGDFAVSGRLTMADCTLVPALFLIENVLPTVGVENPIPGVPAVAIACVVKSFAGAAPTAPRS
mgnify:CR=1 FL=1